MGGFAARSVRHVEKRIRRERLAQVHDDVFESANSLIQSEEILPLRIIHPGKGLGPRPPSSQQLLQHFELLYFRAKSMLLRSIQHPQVRHSDGDR